MQDMKKKLDAYHGYHRVAAWQLETIVGWWEEEAIGEVGIMDWKM